MGKSFRNSKFFGFMILAVMVLFFYAVFKFLSPSNFGSPANLFSYFQSSIIYSVGGCG